MRREHHHLQVDGFEHTLGVVVHGHYGRPVVVFPSEAGRAWDFENNGMVDAVGDLIDAGRVKLYCVDSLDAWSWSDQSISTEERAHRHGAYVDWLTKRLLPFVADTSGEAEPLALGCSLGAYHAVNLALQHADKVPLAIGLSGNYDVSTWRGWGERAGAAYFANPADYVPNLHGDHLAWLQRQVSLLLVCGQGAWETHPTGSLPSTTSLAKALQNKGIQCELDLWGHHVSHDWEWWQRQLAHHLPRFC